MDRGFVLVDELLPDQRPDHLRRRRPHPRPAARPRRLRRGHPGRRADRPACRSCRSTTTACRGSPTATPRSPRSASPPPRPPSAASRSPSSPTTWRATARARSCRRRARSRSSSTAGGGPVLGVHMVGARVGELIAEAQLIYNWEAVPLEVAQLIHPHPTQSEAIGEAHLALAGKPLHVHDDRSHSSDTRRSRQTRRSYGKQCRSP